jgi:hypothetical protein
VNKTFCIAGAGTYGSYAANAIINKYPSANIILIEVGDDKICSESEIGFLTKLTSSSYKASQMGRYFGLGGTSAKWGGQLLFLDSNDLKNTPSMDYIKFLNIKHTLRVLSRFFKNIPKIEGEKIKNGLHIKRGIWLQFNKRNLFKLFKLGTKKIQIHKNSRLEKVHINANTVTSISVISEDKKLFHIYADYFFISCGAIETMRLIDYSGLISLKDETYGFCDHVSTRVFKIKSKPNLFGFDLSYKFIKSSLLTTRIIGEYKGVSFYFQPVFNESFNFFQFLKNLIFKGKFSLLDLYKTIGQFIYLFPFAFEFLVRKRMYVYGEWDLNLDVELNETSNFLKKSDEIDSFGVSGVEINFEIPNSTFEVINYAKKVMKDFLLSENINFEELNEETSAIKLEDTYHPYNMYNKGSSFLDRFNPLPNLFICHTGLLDRAGGINPTATLFCLIEELIEKDFKILSNGEKS